MTPRPCPSCGTEMAGDDATLGLCRHHPMVLGDDWSAANRVWCDWLHRGVPITRLPEAERLEPYEMAGMA